MKKKKRLLWLIPVGLLAVFALCLLLTPKSKTAAPSQTEPTASTREEPAAPAQGEPALSRRETLPAPRLVEEESFFSDFTVRGDRVYFLCRLCIRNPADQPRAVLVTGDFSEDAAGGLLAWDVAVWALRMEDYTPGSFLSMSDEALAAVTDRNADGSLRVFPLQPGDNAFWALFVGDHGTAEVKQNRLLPPISIHVLADVTPEDVLETTGCRIFKDPEGADAFLLDGQRLCELGTGFGGYGLTSAVPWDYDENGTADLLYTYSWGSGMHRSILALYDRTKREKQELYTYYPWDWEAYGSDLVVKHETDSAGNNSYPVFTVDVSLWAYGRGYDFTDLYFTEKAQAGVVDAIWNPVKPELQPLFWPASADFFPLTEDVSAAEPPRSCDFCIADIGLPFTGEKAAELLDFCESARKQAELGDFYVLDRTNPLLTLIFSWDDGNSVVYQIDWKDKGIFGTDYANAQAALQFPAGTYGALWAMGGEPGNPAEGAGALTVFQSCLVTYGGGETELSGDTAQELHRICADALVYGERTAFANHEPEMLYLLLGFPGEDDTDRISAPQYCVYADDCGWFSASGYASFRPELCFPAGTYDALIRVLERDGSLPVPAGERIEGNEVYALFEDKGIYAVQLYGADGELVWAVGPVNHEPLAAEEEPGLWSVSLQAGTGLSTRWTLYYAPETGTLSPSFYAVLDRQGDRLIHLYFSNQLEVRGLFDTEEGTILRHFSEPLSNAAESFVSAHFTEDDTAVVVTYLAGEDYHEVTETIPLP